MRPFVRVTVVTALEAYPRPPRDAPRQLAAVILRSPRVVDLFEARAATNPVRVVSRSVGPVEARADHETASRLLVDTVPALARELDLTVGRLLWLADTRGWNRTAAEGPLHHYRYEWLARPGRTPRLLEKPLHRLKTTQRTILDDLLTALPVHDAAHGFVTGRSAVTGAALHVGQDVVISADLTSFFPSVRAGSVYGVFRDAGFAEPLAHLLTGVCTHRVPVGILSAMPPGGSPDERFALRQRLSAAHLPQGAPTSAALGNLVLRHLDARLAGWAKSAGSVYSRYADDLTFSGGASLASRADAFARGVDRIVADQGYALNPQKTRVRRQGVRQSVTGVVVNERTSAGRREYDLLKATLHNCLRDGPARQNRGGRPDFRAHLAGRVGWFEQCNPERGARLRSLFEQIAWA